MGTRPPAAAGARILGPREAAPGHALARQKKELEEVRRPARGGIKKISRIISCGKTIGKDVFSERIGSRSWTPTPAATSHAPCCASNTARARGTPGRAPIVCRRASAKQVGERLAGAAGDRLARLYPDVRTPPRRCRRSSAAEARAQCPRQPAHAATPENYFLCRDPGAGFAPSCL